MKKNKYKRNLTKYIYNNKETENLSKNTKSFIENIHLLFDWHFRRIVQRRPTECEVFPRRVLDRQSEQLLCMC